ncbi:MAG TPA: preprotein translocase subunit SecE [Gammaproteobacteria bacterium]|nr:preprotein translocase subunit SecE [Gammaproteobacteria bacterium]
MNAKVETEVSRFDGLKMTLAVLLLAGGIGAFYYFGDQLLVVRVLGLLAVAGVAVFIAAQSSMGKGVLGFVTGAQSEVRRVVWPTRAETVQTTLAVLFIVLLVGIALWLLDMVLLWAIKLLTGQGG